MSNIIDTLNSQLRSMSKNELEALRKVIIKELNTRFSNSRKSKYNVPVEERIMNDKELELILNACESTKYRLFFKCLALTGARPGELIKVKLDDLDFKNKCFNVWIEKKNQPIKLPKYFPDILEQELRFWIRNKSKEIQKHEGYIFFNRQTKNSTNHIKSREAGNVFRECLERVNLGKYYTLANDTNNPIIKNQRKLRNYNIRSLRKYFVSKVYSFNRDGLMASRLLHHEHVDTTSNYYVGISKESKLDLLNKTFKVK